MRIFESDFHSRDGNRCGALVHWVRFVTVEPDRLAAAGDASDGNSITTPIVTTRRLNERVLELRDFSHDGEPPLTPFSHNARVIEESVCLSGKIRLCYRSKNNIKISF